MALTDDSTHISGDVEAKLLRLSHSLHKLAKFLDGENYESKVTPNAKLYIKTFRDSRFTSLFFHADKLDYPLGFLTAARYLSAVECTAMLVSPSYEPIIPNTSKPHTGNFSWILPVKVAINPKAGIIKISDFYPPAPGIYFLILRESRTVIHLFALTREDTDRGVVRFCNKIRAVVAIDIFRGDIVQDFVGDNLFEPYEFRFGPKPDTVETPVQLFYRPSSNMVFQI